jgi:hypothetical protein
VGEESKVSIAGSEPQVRHGFIFPLPGAPEIVAIAKYYYMDLRYKVRPGFWSKRVKSPEYANHELIAWLNHTQFQPYPSPYLRVPRVPGRFVRKCNTRLFDHFLSSTYSP